MERSYTYAFSHSEFFNSVFFDLIGKQQNVLLHSSIHFLKKGFQRSHHLQHVLSGNVKQASVTYSPSSNNDSPLTPDNVEYTYYPTPESPDKVEIKFTPFINTVFVTVTLEDVVNDAPVYQVWLSAVACFKGMRAGG